MPRAEKSSARHSILDRADTWLALISSVVLGVLMVFITAGALLRYIFNTPVHGGNELVELACVAMIMLGMAYTTRTDSHIRIDLFDALLGDRGRVWCDQLYRLLGILVLSFLVKAYIARALDAYEYSDRTNMISIPIWPFHALICFGMGSYALILFCQFVGQLTNRERLQ